MEKKELRQDILKQLKRGGLAKEKATKALTASLLAHPSYQSATVIATYLSLPHEFDTSTFIAQALKDGKTIVVPKTFADRQMIFVVYNPEELIQTPFGVMEPISDQATPIHEIDLVHVPGVAFNQQGYRIGYGGGFYDTFLSRYEGKTISTIYSCQQADFQPESHDIPVSEVIVNELY